MKNKNSSIISSSKSQDILGVKSQHQSQQQKPFHIRRRKTFIVEKKRRFYSSRDCQKRAGLSFSSTNTFHCQRKASFQNKRKYSLILSVRDFKSIEEDIKNTIFEMRHTCLWEIRRQSHDISNFFEQKSFKNENKENNDKNYERFEYLDLSDKEDSSIKRSFTHDNYKTILVLKKTIKNFLKIKIKILI